MTTQSHGHTVLYLPAPMTPTLTVSIVIGLLLTLDRRAVEVTGANPDVNEDLICKCPAEAAGVATLNTAGDVAKASVVVAVVASTAIAMAATAVAVILIRLVLCWQYVSQRVASQLTTIRLYC